MKKVVLYCLFLLSLCYQKIEAQVSQDTTYSKSEWYNIVKQNGVEYVGQIISDDGREVLIFTKELGKIYILKSEIKLIQKIKNPTDVVRGEFRDEGPFTTRYFFTTNALSIKKGENYSLVNLYGPEVHFAVTNNTSIGVMATWIGSPIAIAIKHTIKTKNEKLNFSIGTIDGTSGYLNSFKGYGGLTFANVTYGNRNSNLTFATGFSFFNLGEKVDKVPDGYYVYNNVSTFVPYTSVKSSTRFANLFSISGITKVGAKASFICDLIFSIAKNTHETETGGILSYGYVDGTGNWVSDTYYLNVKSETFFRKMFVIMPGMRFQKTEKTAFQFALAGISVLDFNKQITFPAPMCSWFYKF